MPMNGTTLGSDISSALQPPLEVEIKSQLQSFFTIGSDTFSQAQFDKFCHLLSTAIADQVGSVVGAKVVGHITANAHATVVGVQTGGSTITASIA